VNTESSGVSFGVSVPGISPTWLDRNNPNCLNCLRLLFALLVIESHSWALVLKSDPLERLPQNTESLGSLAVNAFFIISGFLITASWMSGRGAEHYLRSRILRIFPGFSVAFIFSALITAAAGAGLAYLHSLSKNQFVMGLFSLHGNVLDSPLAFPMNARPVTVNGSLWTISIEFNCYLALAFIGSLGLLSRTRLLVGFVLISWAIYTAEILLKVDEARGWPRFATMFGAGALFWICRERVPRKFGLAVLAFAVLVFGLFFHDLFKIISPFGGAYLIFYIGFNGPTWMREIGKRNDISYGVYLYAFPIQQILYRLAPSMPHAFHLAFACVLAIGFGWMSWLLVERPASRLK
jgi:peptidoglycan/LPS O-acetylase OafA/YrhL